MVARPLNLQRVVVGFRRALPPPVRYAQPIGPYALPLSAKSEELRLVPTSAFTRFSLRLGDCCDGRIRCGPRDVANRFRRAVRIIPGRTALLCQPRSDVSVLWGNVDGLKSWRRRRRWRISAAPTQNQDPRPTKGNTKRKLKCRQEKLSKHTHNKLTPIFEPVFSKRFEIGK